MTTVIPKLIILSVVCFFEFLQYKITQVIEKFSSSSILILVTMIFVSHILLVIIIAFLTYSNIPNRSKLFVV